jgi:hypothetical protein
MDAGEIRDGYTRVAVEGIDIRRVTALVRIRGGWLIVTTDDARGVQLRGTVVAASGEKTDLGEFDGHWDINADGTLLVAHRDDGYRVTPLLDEDPVEVDLAAPDGAETATADAAFAGDAVLTGWESSAGERVTLRTGLAKGIRKVIPTGDLTDWTASPRGLLIAGAVVDEATSCLEGGQVLGDHDDWWRNCDWRTYPPRPQYTPDGGKLLVVPVDTEGLGPTSYGVLDSETGEVLQEIEPPESTVAAEWGDNDEVFVLVRDDGGAGQAIYRCRLDDACTRERESSRRLVLGAGV